MLLKDNEEDSSHEWERIRNFVGGGNKQSKHPLTQEMERMQSRQPQHMDEGGMANWTIPDPNDPWGGNNPLAPSGPAPIAPPQAPLAPKLPIPAPNAPPPTLPQPGPSMGPSDESYNQKASSILGGVTPEAINQLMQTLNQGSKRAQLGAGIAGIGDAIASVGGQNPGHMKASEDLLQQNKEAGMKLPGEMAAMGKERYGLAQELQAKDPNSPFSKVTQNANRQILKQMGAKDADINTMPATAINDVVGHQVTLQEALARIKQEGAYQQGMLGLQKATLENTTQNQKAQREEEGTRIKAEAAKTLAGQGFINRLTHPAATKALEQTAGIGVNIPDGRVTVISPTGQIGHIPADQLKAALSKGYKQQ